MDNMNNSLRPVFVNEASSSYVCVLGHAKEAYTDKIFVIFKPVERNVEDSNEVYCMESSMFFESMKPSSWADI